MDWLRVEKDAKKLKQVRRGGNNVHSTPNRVQLGDVSRGKSQKPTMPSGAHPLVRDPSNSREGIMISTGLRRFGDRI